MSWSRLAAFWVLCGAVSLLLEREFIATEARTIAVETAKEYSVDERYAIKMLWVCVIGLFASGPIGLYTTVRDRLRRRRLPRQ